MAFAWVRPHDLPLNLPTDEEISQYILSCDPGFHLSHHWHAWRDQMLKGRDTYLGLFQRHQPIPRPPEQPPRPPSKYDNWTPLNMDMIGSQEPRNWRVHSEYRSYLLGLEPCVAMKDQEPISFLGLEMASNRVSSWGSTFNIHGSVKRYHPGYTEWARYILRTEEETLLRMGIFRAILLSIFCYEMNNNLLKAVIENWSPLSNTLFVEDGEITPTLWDMRNMAGLPILGYPYDEHIPEEEIIFGESESGAPRSSQVLKALFRCYHRLATQKRDHVSINSWILEFFSASSLETKFPTPRDPFGIGSDNIQVQNLAPMRDPPGVTDR